MIQYLHTILYHQLFSDLIYRPSFRENKPKTGFINSGTGVIINQTSVNTIAEKSTDIDRAGEEVEEDEDYVFEDDEEDDMAEEIVVQAKKNIEIFKDKKLLRKTTKSRANQVQCCQRGRKVGQITRNEMFKKKCTVRNICCLFL